jgi:hypothetical protein
MFRFAILSGILLPCEGAGNQGKIEFSKIKKHRKKEP